MRRYVVFLMVAALVFLMAGCGSSGAPADEEPEAPADGPETGTVEIRATDAPPEDVTSIVVTIDNIQVHKAGADADSWVTVPLTLPTFDLVDIQGVQVFLGSATVAVGSYTQIRLDVTNVDVTLGGETVSAELPSDKLKVVRTWDVEEGDTTVLTLDFEADKFVIVTGSGRVQVKPVLKLEVTKGERPLKGDGADDADAEPEPLSLTSTAFAEGETIPAQYTCNGQDISPALAWDDAPQGTQSFAVIVDDPDAPGGSWVHWVLFDLPADATELEENLPKSEQLANGARQGTNGFGAIGYGGPCPPSGESHRYPFTLYALDAPLGLDPGASMQQVIDAMAGHILGEATVTGNYQSP